VYFRGASRPLRSLVLALALALSLPLFGAGPAAAGVDLLILSTTLFNGASSPEVQTAQALGLTYEIADPSTWAAKTTAGFASYRAIVLGDPNCRVGDSSIAPAAANALTWGAAVTGNVVILGTDPTFHTLRGNPGAAMLIRQGLSFAVGAAGRTGAYVALSCYYASAPFNSPVPALDGFGPGLFSVQGQGGCPNAAHVVNGQVFPGISDDELKNWSCSTHEGFDFFPSAWTPVAINTDIPSSYTAADGTSGAPYLIARVMTPLGRYVAIGDSFSSGEGVPRFIPPSDSDGCHRSAQAYGPKVAVARFGSDQSGFVACSGAVIKNVFFGQSGEPAQVSALASDVYLVTLSQGGDDIGFPDVARLCVILGVGCEWFKDKSTHQAIDRIGVAGFDPPISDADSGLPADSGRFTLDRLYAGIRARAPHARIIVVGYPRLLPADPPPVCNFLFRDEALWANSIEQYLDATIQKSAARSGAEYIAGSYDAFTGHELCTASPWVNDLHLTDNQNFSFHPNAGGQQRFTDEVLKQFSDATSYLIAPNSTVSTSVFVASGLDQVSFSSSWPGSDVVMSLTSPSGRTITRATAAADVQHLQGQTYEVFTVLNPEVGGWTVRLFGADLPPGGEAVRFSSIQLPHFHRPPDGDFTINPSAADVGAAVAFDASASAAREGSLVSYAWDFGDGSTGSGVTPAHAYARSGRYQVHLTVTDDGGSQGFAGGYVSVREPTRLAYQGPTQGDFHDPSHVQAQLTSALTGNPAAGVVVNFTLSTGPSAQTCSGTTDSSGVAVCALTPALAAGSYTLNISSAQTDKYSSSSLAAGFAVTAEETSLAYTGPMLLAANQPQTFSAALREDGSAPVAGRTLTFNLGIGALAQSCSAQTDVTGAASCSLTVAQPLGRTPLQVTFGGDTNYQPARVPISAVTYAYLAQGSFVLGDQGVGFSAGAQVTFWDAAWAGKNVLSAGAAPDEFKGFEGSALPRCGATWTASPGASGPPPDTVPSYLAVAVSSRVTKSGAALIGDVVHVVVVKVDAGYGPGAGQSGTGVVVGVLC